MNTTQSLSILVLDDSPEDSLQLARRIRASGLQGNFERVRTETQFRIALGAGVHIIFADVAASRLSVRRALELLRTCKLDIPFIVLCKSGDEECGLDDLAREVTDVIPKDRLDLAGPAVRRALRGKAERERLTAAAKSIDDNLATIISDAELALTHRDLPAEAQETINNMKTSAARAVALIRESLDGGQSLERREQSDKTILLVEDDEFYRRWTALGLVQRGYKVLQAASARDALDLWAQQIQPVDLLLTDLVLPGGVSGPELAAQLRDCQQSMKVLFTGTRDPSVTAPKAHLGEHHFLQKPFTIAGLIGALGQCLA
jgi:CheY-like chemotaxis protein